MDAREAQVVALGGDATMTLFSSEPGAIAAVEELPIAEGVLAHYRGITQVTE